jgi:LacI family transcriptional regulator
MSPPKELRIGCHVGTTHIYGLKLQKGILQWRKTKPHVRLLHYASLKVLVRFKPHGVLAQLGAIEALDFARGIHLPIVNLSAAQGDIPFPTVTVDNIAAGRMAAEHFLQAGFKHLGFARGPGPHYALLREKGFVEMGRKALGISPSIYEGSFSNFADAKGTMPYPDELVRWVRSLPKPCGVFCEADADASQLADCLRECGFSIPEDVAIVCCEHQPSRCEINDPTLSCIELPGERIGYLGAELLERILRGEPPPSKPLLVPPENLVVRQSSETLRVDDPHVGRALRHIREYARQPIGVGNVVEASGVSRRGLEVRFRQHTGQSILEAIEAVRLQEARRLLKESNQSMAEVAEQAGFANVQRMGRLVKAATGLTPLAFRKRG